MAGSNDSKAPNGVHAVDASEQLPDCIIASSNRFYDLLPFCTNLYQDNPQMWGVILPWEFPQNANKETEEAFLRKWFTELEIHMQGGAHGDGAGFRFLKQAWYNIAMWNYEQRVPAIAKWWLRQQENSEIMADPSMREFLCSAKATPETFFHSRDVEAYGYNILVCVVKQIQDKEKSENAQPSTEGVRELVQQDFTAESHHTDNKEEASTSSVISPPSALSAPGDTSTRAYSDTSKASTKPTTIDLETTPFPSYHEPAPEPYGHTKGFRDFTPGYGNHHQQVYGRKRGHRFGSGGGTHGSSHDRRQQQPQPHFVNNMQQTSATFEPSNPTKPVYNGEALNFRPASGRVPTAAAPNVTLPIQGAPRGSHPQATHAPRRPMPSQYFGANENYYQGFVNPTAYGDMNAPPRSDYPQAYGRQFTYPNEKDRAGSGRSNDGPRHSNFNDVSNSGQSGDARRSSFTARGVGTRGQNRGRGRGGRTRDSTNEAAGFTDERNYTRKPSNDFHSKSGFGHSKRYGSAYQQNSWRSGSDQPQLENAQPHRFFSEPEHFPAFQGFQNFADAPLLPPFNTPQGYPVVYQGRKSSILHRPPLENQNSQSLAYLDDEVDERYIGPDATHVTELLVYNIPIDLTEQEVAEGFAKACDVEVVRVHIPTKTDAHRSEPSKKVAYIDFKNHNVVRRILDLREVDLYGQPLQVKVPRRLLSPGRAREQHHAPYHNSNRFPPGKAFVPSDGAPRWQHELQQHPMPTMPVMMAPTYHVPSENMGVSYSGFTPSTPSNDKGKKESLLPTVQSADTTPATSGPNTPKKSNKKKKNRNVTPLTKTPRGREIADDTNDKRATSDSASRAKTHEQNLPGSAIADTEAASNTPASRASVASKELQGGTIKKPQSAANIQSSRSVGAHVEDEPLSFSEPGKTRDEKNEAGTSSTHSSTLQDPVLSTQTSEKDRPSEDKTAPVSSPAVDTLNCQLSTPPSGATCQHATDKTSDSDHVDESFHTANASPPGDKQPQAGSIAIDQHPTSPKPPAAGLSVLVHSPTSSKKPPSSDRKADENVPPPAVSQRKVSESTKQAQYLHLEPGSPSKVDKALNPAMQGASSGPSIPPTPVTAYHTAPTTPVPPQTPISQVSTDKASGQPKSATKKGPSQTESFSMFGKKQQKQKKQAKGRGSLKNKPQNSSHTLSLTSGVTSSNFSDTASPASSEGGSKLGKRPELEIKTLGDKDASSCANTSKSANATMSEEAATAPSEQSSPSKRTFGNLFGLLPGMIKSPSLSGKEAVPKDVPSDDELTESKAQATTTQATFGNDPAVVAIEEEENGQHAFRGYENAGSLEGPNIPSGSGSYASFSSNVKPTPKKTKKKNKKSKKTQTHTEEEPSGDIKNLKENERVAAPLSTMADTDDINETVSENKSEDSSTTMGLTPPLSPSDDSPRRRQLIEQKKSEREHLLTARAPRNKHVKRKSSNKMLTSATNTPAPATTPPITDAPTESETRQRGRVLHVYQISNEPVVLEVVSDDDDDARSKICVVTSWSGDENAPQVELRQGMRVAFCIEDDNDKVVRQIVAEAPGQAQAEQAKVEEEAQSGED